MIKNKSLWAFLCMFLFVGMLTAQERTCASHDVHKQMLLTDPEYRANQEAIEASTADYVSRIGALANLGNAQQVELITIPVVFHIVHNGDAVGSGENLSEELIMAQLQQLNEDYRKLNSDRNKIPEEFESLHADFRIEFCLATQDPQGNETTGILRHKYSKSTWSIDDCNSTLKPETIWDRDSYLNIWSVKLKSGLLGYAQFPGGAANTDGVVSTSTSFGSISNPNPNGGSYGRGRTTTHEVGHWLNLRHIWGDDRGACTGTDYVDDTPNQANSYGGSPSHPQKSCDSNDMFMNYMDYVADSAMHMFSEGQKNRSRALFGVNGTRRSLLNSQGCTGGNPDPDPTDPTDPAEPCNDTVVKIQIKTDRYGYETSWTLKNSDGTIVAKGSGYTNSSEQVYTKEVCLKDGCYEFEIKDSGSDGICCNYGNGFYKVYVGGELKISGGEFANSEKKEVCVNTSNDSQAPTTPTGLKATEVTDTSVKLAWNASTDNVAVTGYDIYVNNQKTGTIATPSATLTKLKVNTEYSIYVVAKDAAGNTSAKSNTIKVTTGSASCDDTTVVVKLKTDRYASETSWEIKDSKGNVVASGKNYEREQSYTINNCFTDGCYTFTIRDSANDGICCRYGNGSYELTIDGKTIASGGEFGSSESKEFCVGDSDTIAPTAPTQLIAKQIEKTSATLFWGSSTDNVGVDKYNIYLNDKLVGSTKETSYKLTGLTASTKYSYTVKAEDAAGNISAASNIMVFTTKGDVSSSNKLIVTLTTDKYASETSWDVKDANGKVVASKNTFASSATDIEEVDLASGCYTFTIYDKYKDGICCKYGNGSYKVELGGRQIATGGEFGEFEATEFCTTGGGEPSGDDKDAPTAPSNLSVSNVSANSANLSWSASSDNKGVEGYKVYINNSYVTSVSTTSYTATGLTQNTSYTAYVIAYDAAKNESTRSDSVSFKTSAGVTLTYCELKGANSAYEWIDYVKLGDMENTSGSDNGYGDYTSKVANIARGAQSTFIASAGFAGSAYRENWQMWIDYNQDGVFSADEKVFSGSTQDAGNGEQVFTVPTTAKLGLTRLRVSMRYGTSSEPCGTYGYGEVEDYSVNISASAGFFGRYATVDASSFGEIIEQSPVVTYPNPSIEGQAVYLRARDNVSRYKIYDMSGKIVAESSVTGSNVSLNTQELNKGSYIVVAGDGRHQFNESIVIQ